MASQFIIFIFVIAISTQATCEETTCKPDVDHNKQSKPTNLIDPSFKDHQITQKENSSTIQRSLIVSKQGFGREFAGIETNGQIIQTQAKIHIFQPKVAPHHVSSAFVAIESGSGNRFNEIQVGWTVNPDFYGDDRVRFHVKWTGDNNMLCYDNKCPGFVKTTEISPLGEPLSASDPSKNYHQDLYVSLVQEWDRNWWLYYTLGKVKVGYWDQKYLSSLTEVATKVRFGGEVFTPPNSLFSPPMGSGKFIKSYFNYETAYFSDIKFNEDDKELQDSKVTKSRCYFVSNVGFGGPQGFGFLYGGVGGRDQETCVY